MAVDLLRVNSRIQVDAMADALTPTNARALLGPYDVILDCTDNPPTRYLLSDTAVLLGKPLVSGAAQRFDGQLCTYNLGPDGPCYRCLFPRPPSSPEAAPSCEETGILGPVTGVVGSLQALEAIKIIVGLHGRSLSPPPPLTPPGKQIRCRVETKNKKLKRGFRKNADVMWCVSDRCAAVPIGLCCLGRTALPERQASKTPCCLSGV
jgi:molybdopterin/thiamine biosynthesis adenylyltransferase